MNITVYLGSSFSNSEKLIKTVQNLGDYIGKNGHTLVYGGSKSGLMGQLASHVLDNNGKVIGVEPKFFIDEGYVYDRISKLYVTEDMSSRRLKMIELGDVFIAMPGGVGTLEEVSEVMCKIGLKHLNSPCIIYNLDGYYNPFKELLNNMLKYELSDKNKLNGIYFVESIEEIDEIINDAKRKNHNG